ncbi:GRAP2 [Branchiostoma lanceolatum]|uniref:GRAP2 protein n=1 Tax=Branchiostoma lanceolatum TaxID=7740 RepID=A0A8J9YWT9_BRALA|nr:GRAP2 [Branchiostoma lanceolatum]
MMQTGSLILKLFCCPITATANRIFARAKSDYTPKEENELQLHVADVVQILSTENNGWYFGYLHGRMGLFPANCVEIIKFDSRKPNKQPIPHGCVDRADMESN